VLATIAAMGAERVTVSSSWVTLAAAFIAATAAIFNVMITRSSTSGIELHKWRRQQVGELGARIIVTVHGLIDAWREVAVGRAIMLEVSDETWERAHGEVKSATARFAELMDTVELTVAELDLLAGSPVATYSANLLLVLDEWRGAVLHSKSSEATDELLATSDEMTIHVHAALFELVDVMRSDLGIEKRTVFRVKPEYRTLVQ
jgi:hypothetical protein